MPEETARRAGGGARTVGDLLRELRERHRISQFDLALRTDVSQRHLSFVETGRALPSPDLIARLAERLDLTAAERNRLLLAAGHAPVYTRTTLDAAALDAIRGTVRRVLHAHEPAPAMLLDRHWNMLEGNRAVGLLAEGVAPRLLEPPVNVLRVSLDPEGLAPRIANLPEWRAHLLARVREQIAVTGDTDLVDLLAEVSAHPCPEPQAPPEESPVIAVPLRLRDPSGDLSFLSTMTVFGTALDVSIAELAVETFFPADARTAAVLKERFEAVHA